MDGVRLRFGYWTLLIGLSCSSLVLWRAWLFFTAEPDPEWKASIQEQFRRKIVWKLVEVPAIEALEYLAGKSGVDNWQIDVGVREKFGDLKITAARDNVSVRETLETILNPAGLTYDLLDHVVFVGEGPRVEEVRNYSRIHRSRASRPAIPKAEKAIHSRLRRPVTFCTPETPLDELLDFFLRVGDVSIVLDEAVAARARTPVGIGFPGELKDIPLESVIAWTVRGAGLEYEVRSGHVFVGTPERLGLRPSK